MLFCALSAVNDLSDPSFSGSLTRLLLKRLTSVAPVSEGRKFCVKAERSAEPLLTKKSSIISRKETERKKETKKGTNKQTSDEKERKEKRGKKGKKRKEEGRK